MGERCPLVVFTKHLRGWELEELAGALASAGADGADLCVRPGYPVEPETVAKTLPEAVRVFEARGLVIPLVTLPGDFTDPAHPAAGTIWKVCGECGVRHVKIGYWFVEEGGYWATVERCRRRLAEFEELSAACGVTTLVHTHSMETMGLNAAGAMNLVRGFDPRRIGVFPDTGHLSVVGEPLNMALDIVRDHLAALAVKDFVKVRTEKEVRTRWETKVVPLGEGFVDFDVLSETLEKLAFSGPISLHSEYDMSVPEVLARTKKDVAFFRRKVNAGSLR